MEGTGPREPVCAPPPLAHHAVGGGPPGGAPLPDALHGQPPALFDAKAPVSAWVPASLRRLAHLRGQDSGSAGHAREIAAPASPLHPPQGVPSPHRSQVRLPGQRAGPRSPWSRGFPRLCAAVCAGRPPAPPAPVRTGQSQTGSLQRRLWPPSSGPDRAPEPATRTLGKLGKLWPGWCAP